MRLIATGKRLSRKAGISTYTKVDRSLLLARRRQPRFAGAWPSQNTIKRFELRAAGIGEAGVSKR